MARVRHVKPIAVIHLSTLIKGFLAVLGILLALFCLTGLLTSLKPEYRITSDSVHSAAGRVSGQLLFSMMASENHHFGMVLPEQEDGGAVLSRQVLKLASNISLDDPRSLLGRELPGFSIFDNDILVAGQGTNYTNMPYESAPPLEVLNEKREAALQNLEDVDKPKEEVKERTRIPAMTTKGKKVVQIYHSHNRESFLPYLKGVTNPNHAHHSVINITKLGEQLKKDLADKGIGADTIKGDIQALLNKKGLSYGRSYQESRSLVQAAMAGNKDIEYLIDIHRDSQRKKNTTIQINGKAYAKIAFIIGKDNPGSDKNASLANKLHKGLEKKYPGLSRGIFPQGGAGNNGVYNQDLSGRAMLIEVGGVDNTFEEMYRTLSAFADIFGSYYWDAEQVSSPSDKPAAK